MEEIAEYRVSPRVLLQKGDEIHLSGGPYWLSAETGRTHLISPAKGRCIFYGVYTDAVGNLMMKVGHDGRVDSISLYSPNAKEPGLGESGIVHRPYVIKKRRLKC